MAAKKRKLQFESLDQRIVFATLPDFTLTDVNGSSASLNQPVSLSQYQGEVSAWYFAHANCGYCTAQFGHLDAMQKELSATYPLLKIQLHGVNEAGFETANAQITQGRTLPWLQDVDADNDGNSDLWKESWNVAFRDVVIANGAGEKTEIYNLTSHNLGDPQNYATLRGMLLDAAMATQAPFTNKTNPADTNQDGSVAPLDALLVIIELNQNGGRKLAPVSGSTMPGVRFDTNADGSVTPLDALLVIIELNEANPPSGESAPESNGLQAQGESPSASDFHDQFFQQQAYSLWLFDELDEEAPPSIGER